MSKIKDMFDSTRSINRAIEKVITYGAAQEQRLKDEIAEYVVTESMEEQFEKLLSSMQLAMDQGGANEIGVWVSGFYGSGKSSFTKYTGLALDESITVDGRPFRELLAERFHKPQTKALLNTLASKHPAAVVMLDLASEMLAGATMEDVSSVLYYKVLQWAGFSRNLRVAALERKLQKDGKYEDFKKVVADEYELDWQESQNDPLVYDSVVPELAHRFYPNLYKTAESFSTSTEFDKVFENVRVKEMLDIVREKSGKEVVIFVIDEVGQYVGSRQDLILNLDGLAKNLKANGNGKVWIMSTAQQTLTEDDPRAALNSPELYKLNARFPITVALESSDIKEICYRRLLGKSTQGQQQLEALFDQYGQSLRHATKLTDARQFEADFDKKVFAELYPFLPAHFEILLILLGALAKSTGGIGLRSAIKVIQDILVEARHGQSPVSDREIGYLASMVTLYDALDRDIPRAFPAIAQAVDKVKVRFPEKPLCLDVAKTVAILKIINQAVPSTPENVAALIQSSVQGASLLEDVKKAADELVRDAVVPFAVNKDGRYDFYSEKLNDIDRERADLPVRQTEFRRIVSETLKNAFLPLPNARIFNALTVKAGVKFTVNGTTTSLEGDREALQFVFEYAKPADYDQRRATLVLDSRATAAQMQIFVLGQSSDDFRVKAEDIFRSEEIANRHRNDADAEVREYNAAQKDRAATLRSELERLLRNGLAAGSFVFHGQDVAVDTVDAEIVEATKKELATVAAQIYDRYQQAAGAVETGLPERFLRAASDGLNRVTTAVDPLHLVKVENGTYQVDTAQAALRSIHDQLEMWGNVDGRALQDFFNAAPYGWALDMTRYLVAALLVSGEITLVISGRDISTNGQAAIDALCSNVKFKNVGIRLRSKRPSMEMLGRAAQRLVEIVGEQVIPLEDAIAKACRKHFPALQQKFGTLADALERLDLPKAADVKDLNRRLKELLETDASEATTELGAVESVLFAELQFAKNVEQAFAQGLDETVRELRDHEREIAALSDAGVTGTLKASFAAAWENVQPILASDDFYAKGSPFATSLQAVKDLVSTAVQNLTEELRDKVQTALETLHASPDWAELKPEEQQDVTTRLNAVIPTVSENLVGLKQLVSGAYAIQNQITAIAGSVAALAKQRRDARAAAAAAAAKAKGRKLYQCKYTFPRQAVSVADLDAIIAGLADLKKTAEANDDIDITFDLEG